MTDNQTDARWSDARIRISKHNRKNTRTKKSRTKQIAYNLPNCFELCDYSIDISCADAQSCTKSQCFYTFTNFCKQTKYIRFLVRVYCELYLKMIFSINFHFTCKFVYLCQCCCLYWCFVVFPTDASNGRVIWAIFVLCILILYHNDNLNSHDYSRKKNFNLTKFVNNENFEKMARVSVKTGQWENSGRWQFRLVRADFLTPLLRNK